MSQVAKQLKCHSRNFLAGIKWLIPAFAGMTLFVFSTAAFAEVAIETSVSRSVLPVGEQLVLDIIISNANGRIEQPMIGPIDGFTSYSQGRSQELSIVNGQSSSRSIFSYVLVANSSGEKTIGPFQVVIDGKEYKVSPVKVTVNQGITPPVFGGAQTSASTLSPRAMPSGVTNDQDIFVKAWLDKDEVYVNEPVILTYTLFTRRNASLKGFEKDPVTTGFWVEDFPPNKVERRSEQLLNGEHYLVVDIKKLALFPTQAGIFTVDPGILSANVELRNEDSFDSFFSGNASGRRRMGFPTSFISQLVGKILSTDPLKVVVKALPEAGKPAGFSGAVGKYSIESSLDKTDVEAGNPVTLRVRISGQGNIDTLQMPVLSKLDDFKVYDSAFSKKISKERLVVEGEKVTETVIVPRKPGTFTIPVLSFSYFDPKTESYKELKTQAHTLTVTKGSEPEAPAPEPGVQPVEKEDVGLATKDIRYIKTVDDGKPVSDRPLYKNPVYWLINILLALAGVLAMFFSSRKANDQKDAKGFRFRRSHTLARGKLKAAARMLHQERSDAFYEEVSKAVYGYFADKLDIPAQSVSRERIEALSGNDVLPELMNKIGFLFDELSRSRFAHVEKGQDDMKNIYDLADEVITKFEKMRKK